MFKKLFSSFLGGLAVCLGYLVGADLWQKFKDPVRRANRRRKFTRIKNIILNKEES